MSRCNIGSPCARSLLERRDSPVAAGESLIRKVRPVQGSNDRRIGVPELSTALMSKSSAVDDICAPFVQSGFIVAEAVGLEPTTDLTSAPAFELCSATAAQGFFLPIGRRLGLASGRMTSLKLRWQDSNLHASP